MPLGRFADAYTEEAHRLPLGSVIDTLTETTGAGVYQALITPHPDLTGAVSDRIARLQANQDTFRQQVANTLLGAPDPQTDVEDLLPTERDRIAGLETRHAHNTFTLTARAGVTTDEAGGPDSLANSPTRSRRCRRRSTESMDGFEQDATHAGLLTTLPRAFRLRPLTVGDDASLELRMRPVGSSSTKPNSRASRSSMATHSLPKAGGRSHRHRESDTPCLHHL
ncbi:hypothetical protein ACFQFH_14930 [Halobaculum halobium]|uniref:hypothetical protein n=1 Tax=Halobaculum halobium TaxID=3032281 RepID=UPI00361EAB77